MANLNLSYKLYVTICVSVISIVVIDFTTGCMSNPTCHTNYIGTDIVSYLLPTVTPIFIPVIIYYVTSVYSTSIIVFFDLLFKSYPHTFILFYIINCCLRNSMLILLWAFIDPAIVLSMFILAFIVVIACVLFERKRVCTSFCYHLYIFVLPFQETQLSRGKGGQNGSWISKCICRGLFYVQWLEVKGHCTFCWYWWSCWSSLFKGVPYTTGR